MKRLFLISLLCLTGCEGLVGPFKPREPQRVDDPRLTISQQERRGRDRLAIPEDNNLEPKTGISPPGTIGR
jgi:hypothetical protein